MERNYTAFISYRHCPDDIAVAEKLHKLLEHYHVPGDLRKDGRKGLGIIFRDRDELPLSNNLSADLYHALDHSAFLIVVCTPDTPKSLWVDREIEHFISKHGRERILVVLAAGTPEESIPPRITTQYADDGVTVLERFEPLCAYLAAETRTRMLRNLKKELPRLAAALLNCPYDSLIQRQKRYALKKGLTIGSILTIAILCVALGFILMLTSKNAQIRAQLRQSQLKESEALALISAQQLADGDRMSALEKALTALPSPENDRPYLAAAEEALANALHVYAAEGFYFDRRISQDDMIRAFALSDNGRYAATIDSNGSLRCFDVATGLEMWSCRIAYYYYYGYSNSSDRLLFLEDRYLILTFLYEIQVHDLLTGEILYSEEYTPENGITLNGTHYSDEKLQSHHSFIDYWASVAYDPSTGLFSSAAQSTGIATYALQRFELSEEKEIVCLLPLPEPDCILFLLPKGQETTAWLSLPTAAVRDTIDTVCSFPTQPRFLTISHNYDEDTHWYNYTCAIYDALSFERLDSFFFYSYELFDSSWTFSPDETQLFQKGTILDLSQKTLSRSDTEGPTENDRAHYDISDTVPLSRATAGSQVYTAYFDPAADILCWTENGQNIQYRQSPYDLAASEGWMYPWNLTEIGANGLILLRNYKGNITYASSDADFDRLRPTEYIIYSIENDSWQCLENPCSADGIPALTFGLSHSWIAFADFDNHLRIYDAADAAVIREWELPVSAASVSDLRFLCDDSLLLIRTYNSQLHIMDTSAGIILGTYTLADFSDNNEYHCRIVNNDSATTPSVLYISDPAAQGTGLRIDMTSWTVLARIPRMACFLPDSNTVVCGSSSSWKLRVLPVYSLAELLERGYSLLPLLNHDGSDGIR